MRNEKVLTTIAGAGLTSRLEVAMCMEAQDGRTLELRRLSWGDGVGWYCQHTLRLDPREAESLFWALRGSRPQWREQSVEKRGKVIALPGLRRTRENRCAPFPENEQGKQPDNLLAVMPGAEKRGVKRRVKKSATSRA